MDKIKKKAINHGVLAILCDLYESPATEFTVKRLINTKILAYIDTQDLTDQLKIIKESNSLTMQTSDPTPKDFPSPSKVPTLPVPDSNLLITGNKIELSKIPLGQHIHKTQSPRTLEIDLKPMIPSPTKSKLNLSQITESISKVIESHEAKNQKIKEDEENRRKKLEESKNTSKLGYIYLQVWIRMIRG